MYYINKIKKHLITWWDYIKEHLVRMFFLLFLFSSLCIIFCFFPRENIIQNGMITEQHIMIFGITLGNWFTYISMIALLITAIWAIYQFDKNNSRKQQEKGAEIAKLFSEDLLFKCTILGKVILDSGIGNLFKLNILDYRKFKNFDRAEMYNIYKSDDEIFLKLKQLLFSDNTQQIYLRYLDDHISLVRFQELSDKVYSNEDIKLLFNLDNKNMPFLFNQLVSSVLNELEYISMYIASQSAGSKYVYQSLHQIFLRTVKLLAPIIALENKNYSDKYYINIIHVYNEWAHLREIDEKKEKKNKEKANKILNPKIKTV